MRKVDMLIVGGGTAGEYAGSTAAGLAESVALAEREAVGGACVFTACIPTKAMVHAARRYKQLRTADFFGLPVVPGPADFASVKAFKDRVISSISGGRDARLEKAGVQVIQGEARFRSASEVEVNDEVIQAGAVIICTGSMPSAPPIAGLNETGYITNVEALELTRPPERLAVVGGGAVGLEFAQILSAFGSQVHVYEALDRILSVEDHDVSAPLTASLRDQGIAVSTGVKIEQVAPADGSKRVTSVSKEGERTSAGYDEILVATGRKPAIEELNLEAAGVGTWKKGIEVDKTLRTGAPHIWAAGDVTGGPLFTFVAGEQAKTAVLNATRNEQREIDYRVLPRATFCDPEVASVGLTEEQAREQGRQVKAGAFDFSGLTRPLVTGETEGFVKVVTDADTGEILGGHIVGAEASTLIHEIAAAMVGRLRARDLGTTLHAYPTLAEGIRYACQSL